MASQIGNTRTYSSVKEETGSAELKSCPLCKVTAVPRKITSTRRVNGTTPSSTPRHCPNCGHVFDADNRVI